MKNMHFLVPMLIYSHSPLLSCRTPTNSSHWLCLCPSVVKVLNDSALLIHKFMPVFLWQGAPIPIMTAMLGFLQSHKPLQTPLEPLRWTSLFLSWSMTSIHLISSLKSASIFYPPKISQASQKLKPRSHNCPYWRTIKMLPFYCVVSHWLHGTDYLANSWGLIMAIWTCLE